MSEPKDQRLVGAQQPAQRRSRRRFLMGMVTGGFLGSLLAGGVNLHSHARQGPRWWSQAGHNFENAQRYAAGAPVEASVVPLHPTGARLCIADHGPSVPAQERERIFAPFYRPTGMRERGDGGVGIGLALVRQIARHHGGDVRCVPRHGGGTCFEGTLRLRP